MKQSRSSILLTAVSLLLSLAVFSSLPEQIPAHWNTRRFFLRTNFVTKMKTKSVPKCSMSARLE